MFLDDDMSPLSPMGDEADVDEDTTEDDLGADAGLDEEETM